MVTIAADFEVYHGANSHVLRHKARALAKLGETEEASQNIERAIAADPKDGLVHTFYGTFLSREGRFREAFEEYE